MTTQLVGQSSGPDLSRLIATAQATTQAINNLNQTLTTSNTEFSNLSAFVSDIASLINGVPTGATIVNGSSGLSTNSTPTATIVNGGTTNQRLYITGYDVSFSGQSSASFAGVEVTGIQASAGVLMGIPVGATTAASFIYKFPTPIPATGTSISVAFGPLGSGTAGAWVNAYGFYV